MLTLPRGAPLTKAMTIVMDFYTVAQTIQMHWIWLARSSYVVILRSGALPGRVCDSSKLSSMDKYIGTAYCGQLPSNQTFRNQLCHTPTLIGQLSVQTAHNKGKSQGKHSMDLSGPRQLYTNYTHLFMFIATVLIQTLAQSICCTGDHPTATIHTLIMCPWLSLSTICMYIHP